MVAVAATAEVSITVVTPAETLINTTRDHFHGHHVHKLRDILYEFNLRPYLVDDDMNYEHFPFKRDLRDLRPAHKVARLQVTAVSLFYENHPNLSAIQQTWHDSHILSCICVVIIAVETGSVLVLSGIRSLLLWLKNVTSTHAVIAQVLSATR